MKPGFLWTSNKVYTSRPPANCRSARAAWDGHIKGGPIVWMRLLDGYWGAKREDGSIDEVDNCFAMNKRKAESITTTTQSEDPPKFTQRDHGQTRNC